MSKLIKGFLDWTLREWFFLTLLIGIFLSLREQFIESIMGVIEIIWRL